MNVDRTAPRRRRSPYAIVIAALVLTVALLAFGVGSGPANEGVAAPAGRDRIADTSATARNEARSAEATRAPVTAPSEPDAAARARRDRLRERILDALARSEPNAGAEATPRGPDRAGPPHAEEGEHAVAGTGGMRDRIGGRDALLAALNEDFLPLAQECIAAAQERDPSLQGMLAVGLQVIADAELGAVVEAVDFPETGEVHESLLHECIRETSLSTILPPPPEGGREELMLTMPIEPAQDSA